MSDALPQRELQVGGAVPPDKAYVVRRTDDELLRALKEGEYCNVLCPRQMGKTSAIMRIRSKLRGEGCRTALIDIAGRLGTPINAEDWYLGLLRECSSQFKLNCDVRAWWEASSEPTANQKLLTFFREQMLGAFSDRFVVFLDEIDHTLNLTYTDDFFVAIRSFYNDRAAEPDLRRLTFCLVGVFTPNELVKQRRTTTYNIGRTFELEDFDPERDDLSQLAGALSTDPSQGNALLRAVLRWTGGQPYLTASACKKVAAAGIDSAEAVDRLVEDVFLSSEKPLEDSDGTHFVNISRFLEQRVSALRETADLYRRILRGREERESPTPAVVALKLSGLVKSDRNGRLVVRNRIYLRRFDEDWAMIVLSLGERPIRAQTPKAGSDALPNTELIAPGENISKLLHDGLSSTPESAILSTGRFFISHSSQDDAFVRDLRAALADHGQDGWIDSRELRGGDPLWLEIQVAIEEASAYAVVISPEALQSKWVGKELRHALAWRDQRGKDKFPVIPLSLNGTKLGVLEEFFGEEPVYIPVSSDASGVEAAMNAILIALGKRYPADVAPTLQPKAEPLEELVLEFTDLKFHQQDGVRRASARARLVYEPATPGQRHVHSTLWRFVAPIGPIEADELRWYLEKYALWPSHYFRDRALKVEENLVKWGQLLQETVMPVVHTAKVMQAWAKIGAPAGRRFSVHVDTDLEAGTPDADVKTAKEAAALLLALPWELLHDGKRYFFEGAKPVLVRRRLPATELLDVPVVATPIRILLVTARPEDEACGYIDHRASALPLVEVMESLPGLVKIHVLNPPTLPALGEELDRARDEKKPYHVVHFDGHGVYDRMVGLGGLCFENPEDTGKLVKRRHATVLTSELRPLLRDHRIPLVLLEACQTAQAEKASESVASELLKVGVSSVVAMSHSVLVETARRFVEAFYRSLAAGKRVGEAILAGRRELKDDTFRGRIFGAGELRLEDWFVPVLYQEKDDPQLFKTTAAKQTQEDFQIALAARLGDLPPAPKTGFIGRSRELLALQRLLHHERYAVVRGQGGEGKTALAVEFASWMVRSQQMHRAAFVSVEMHGNQRAVLDALGKQLVKREFSAAGDLETAIQEIERALLEQPTLLVVDNMESVLLPPFLAKETPEALFEEAREELKAILALCERLLKVGQTRLIFTSREALPAPFDAERHRRELLQLDREDAVKLVERVLHAAGGKARAPGDVRREEIEELVGAVHCHARTLAVLAPALRSQGIEATRESLVELMAEMEKQFPGSREKSVFASVELSLRRLSEGSQDRVRLLGLFHGGVYLGLLRVMMEWEEADVASFANELIETGLATPNRYNFLTLNPALCPYLRGQIESEQLDALTARWIEAMVAYVEFLVQQQSQSAEVAATLTVLDLPNLFALLDLVQHAGNAEATIGLATSLYSLLQALGKPQLLERVGHVRDSAAAALGDAWNHARFQVARTRIEQQLSGGQFREALEGAQQLLQRARLTVEQGYPAADYDLAMAHLTQARALQMAGSLEQVLPLLDEAGKRFEVFAKEHRNRDAKRMSAVCLAEKGDTLRGLGRFDEAAAAYEEYIRRAEQLGADRDVAVGKAQLGTVRIGQRNYQDALAAYDEARERFNKLDDPGSVATIWHQTGIVYQYAGQLEAAEDAYRKSLAIKVRLENVAGQARTLGQLGNLYLVALDHPEEAVTFLRRAADKYVEIGDAMGEGRQRNNLAGALRKLGRLEEALQEIRRAIKSGEQFGHASSPWVSWAILASIETDAGNAAAAAEAKSKAINCYLAYRRDGGENQDPEGRIAFTVTQSLIAGDDATAATLLQQLADTPDAESLLPFIRAFQAIVAGSRDRTLADAPDLDYTMAAEILFMIETLEKPR
jgi:tetratricopeptide (TPR) repeat protein